MQRAPKIHLNNGATIDAVGYGVYKVPPDETARLCTAAIHAGYRTLDTAALYGNEEGIGQAVRDAADTIARSELFVTTKVWNSDHGYDATLRAFEESLRRLGLDYVDLYLIHWPCPKRSLYLETYRALEQLYIEGRVRGIGVSNFQQAHLERLLDAAAVVPALNQVELHPYLRQHALRAFHESHAIATQAWSPLGRGAVLEDEVIRGIAAECRRTPAQVILRWHYDTGNLTIPKASSTERIAANLDIFDFELGAGHTAAIARLDRDQRFGSHPDTVN
ncbi:aldo/keto reductase [Arthrobacter sp. Br18]|uniref:aldo/keto reductase n=1 Tax=Arthrobacter sp. Br18 TaxID=1312954 RepID=UPI000479DD0E|nr:aldo/keto reductase [Arthrobacter sp. Br18]